MKFFIRCVECSVEFEAESPRAKYCKRSCGKIAYERAHPGWRMKYHLRTRYGLSIEQFETLKQKADGKCQICRCEFSPDARGNERLSVDHDHATGEIRGILCHQCNAGLGWFKDQPELLRSAADYLERK